ncbi:gas vesicle protein [Ralstonia chuxiongensis]|uniref:gas vesicle protein n=1 Tax=Ralstonia chuxiongensis TaxID=2957504 RepID=UPI0028F61B60|nr:gas vesicle protein [Ralstonia chuxiongensis]CAJ0779902.1 hypothetical protein R8510_04675 [Ralstonia chuxiongensis]
MKPHDPAGDPTCLAPVWCADMDPLSTELAHRLSLCEALDRILNRGAVIAADAVISVADVNLIRLQLRVLVSVVESVRTNCNATTDKGAAP